MLAGVRISAGICFVVTGLLFVGYGVCAATISVVELGLPKNSWQLGAVAVAGSLAICNAMWFVVMVATRKVTFAVFSFLFSTIFLVYALYFWENANEYLVYFSTRTHFLPLKYSGKLAAGFFLIVAVYSGVVGITSISSFRDQEVSRIFMGSLFLLCIIPIILTAMLSLDRRFVLFGVPVIGPFVGIPLFSISLIVFGMFATSLKTSDSNG